MQRLNFLKKLEYNVIFKIFYCKVTNKELDKMIERIEIKKNILNGEIDSALEKVSMTNNK